MVGAVIVDPQKSARRTNAIVGEGFHHYFGGPHAEVMALAAAGKRSRGATLYVTLEPCCHWGKTPPCTDAILAAGIRRVVMAMIDPFAKVRGKGAAVLRRAGLNVSAGLLEADARTLNAAFITRIEKHRPYVIAKWAQSLDGRIATATGQSKWISSEVSRRWVHGLRGRVDGILVGIGTVLKDDPLLTARVLAPDGKTRRPSQIATRIILDSECRLPAQSRLLQTLAEAPVLVVHAKNLSRAADSRRRRLAERGAMLFAAPTFAHGRLRLDALLRHLADLEYTHLLVEGGALVLGSFFEQRLVDEAHAFIAPLVIGGTHAPHAVAGLDIAKLSQAAHMQFHATTRSGPDMHLVLRPAAPR